VIEENLKLLNLLLVSGLSFFLFFNSLSNSQCVFLHLTFETVKNSYQFDIFFLDFVDGFGVVAFDLDRSFFNLLLLYLFNCNLNLNLLFLLDFFLSLLFFVTTTLVITGLFILLIKFEDGKSLSFDEFGLSGLSLLGFFLSLLNHTGRALHFDEIIFVQDTKHTVEFEIFDWGQVRHSDLDHIWLMLLVDKLSKVNFGHAELYKVAISTRRLGELDGANFLLVFAI